MVSDLTTNIITAICLLLIGVSQLQFNFSNLSDMNRYPHYLYEYFYRLIRVPLMFHLLVLVSYVRNGELRKTIFREFQAWWGEFFSGKNTFYCDVWKTSARLFIAWPGLTWPDLTWPDRTWPDLTLPDILCDIWKSIWFPENMYIDL